MLNKNIIDAVKDSLILEYNPIEIYIFGSYAWGNPTKDSDLDLLIIIEKFKDTPYDTIVNAHKLLAELDISKDILILTKSDFDEKSKQISTLSYKIKKEGKLIYAKA